MIRQLAHCFIIATSLIGLACNSLSTKSAPPPSAESDGLIRHPSLAVSSDGSVHAAWGAVSSTGTADIVWSLLDERGQPTNPKRINPVAGSAVAGRQVGPRIAFGSADEMFISWVDRSRDPTGDIVVARSLDAGRTFSEPMRVNSDGGQSGQEYHDLVVLPDGKVVVTWLDERDAPVDYENQKQLFVAVSEAGKGKLQFENRRITDSPKGVCPCCRPSIAVSPEGSIHIAYRDRDGDSLRVHVVSAAADTLQFRKPVPVPGPSWKYPACPVDGPSVAASRDGRVVVAWKDGALGRETLWSALSRDGGRSFGTRESLGHATVAPTSATKNHAMISFASSKPASCCNDGAETLDRRAKLLVASDGAILAAWEENGSRLWARSIAPRGERFLIAEATKNRFANSVCLAAGHGVIYAAWVDEGLGAVLGTKTGASPEQASRLGYAEIDRDEQTQEASHPVVATTD